MIRICSAKATRITEDQPSVEDDAYETQKVKNEPWQSSTSIGAAELVLVTSL